MKNLLLAIAISPLGLMASPVVSGDYTLQENNTSTYIAPTGSKLNTQAIATTHQAIRRVYDREFGYRLDAPLRVSLASNRDQVANAFSTQLPLNEQVLYGAGVLHEDVFGVTSWLRGLLLHETAHNYQLNPKMNGWSRLAHAIGGNAPVIAPFFVPMFPIPNITESSFIKEGNAVLNESRFGNGGRLWSGRALAETVTQVRAGRVTPEMMYNSTLQFPYGEKFYLVGGHFQKFLAQRYGMKRVNGYFKEYAKQPFPFFGNTVFKRQFGKDFVTLMKEFRQSILREHRGFHSTKGKVLAHSQLRVPLSREGDKVLALVGDQCSAPKVVRFGQHGKMQVKKGAWHSGNIVSHNGKYYTSASAKISPQVIRAGLFDRDGYLLSGTAGKAIQGRMHDGRWVYFDIASSWDQPHLYVGGHYYGLAHSSVLVRGDALYYFRQQGDRRTLYRNHMPLVSYRGHDGHPVDVDRQGRVYFVAPSRHGSTVYRTSGHGIERVVSGDDVTDLKLMNGKRALVQTIGADGYAVRSVYLQPHPAKVASLDPGLKQVNLGEGKGGQSFLGTKKNYSPITHLQYTNLTSFSTYDTKKGYGLTLKADFTDPLWRNTLSFALDYQKTRTLLQASYANTASPIHFGGSVTWVMRRRGKEGSTYRDWGYSAYLRWPFLATGYWRGSAKLAFARSYRQTDRTPVSLSVDLKKRLQFGFSKYPDELLDLSAFVSYDRGAVYAGVNGVWMHNLPGEMYVGARGAYRISSRVDTTKQLGIKVGTASPSSADLAVIRIPTSGTVSYAREAMMGEVGLYKVFNFSAYSYHLPLSLQRESIYLKQRLYALDFGDGKRHIRQESIAGVEADLLLLHNYTVPVSMEVLYNPGVKRKVQVRVGAKYRF